MYQVCAHAHPGRGKEACRPWHDARRLGQDMAGAPAPVTGPARLTLPQGSRPPRRAAGPHDGAVNGAGRC